MISLTLPLSTFSASLTPAEKVRDIFVPVSPSGTGNTLRASISEARLERWFIPLSSICLSIIPFIVSIAIILLHHLDTLDIDIDRIEFQLQCLFHHVLHFLLCLMHHFADLDAMETII